MRNVYCARAFLLALLAVCLSWQRQVKAVGSSSETNNDSCAAGSDDDETYQFFPSFPGGRVPYLGPETNEPFAFKHYNESEVVLGKTMKDWLRFSVAFWHTIRNDGSDPFGTPTKRWPWDETCGDNGKMKDGTSGSTNIAIAKRRMRAIFELMRKLGVDRWCFHDRDIAPPGKDFAETNSNLEQMADYALHLQRGTNIKPLWGTAQLFAEPHYMSGAATSPHVDVFIRAAAQVKKAMEVTLKLGGENFNFWGGREGYSYLPTTDIGKERKHAALFLRMAANHWYDVLGATGTLLIEPKPQEPSKHQVRKNRNAQDSPHRLTVVPAVRLGR